MKKPKFQVGEKIFAGDKGKHYEAKVIKCESLGNIFKYFIHYQGWDRKHDCWLDESNVEPFDNASKLDVAISKKVKTKATLTVDNPETAQSTDADISQAESTLDKTVPSTIDTSNKRDSSSKRQQPQSIDATLQANKKRKKELATTDLVEDDDEKNYKLTFNIPCDLKRHLVDEWVIITQEKSKRFLKLTT